jgi:DNA repair protein RecN (Recombination protein N)
MLRSLHIQNYALIDSVEVIYPDNLAIITGETGAGKSILLGALSLILGQRAETELVNDKSKKCIVEGKFKSANQGIKSFFTTNDLDYEEDIILRREVSPEGKSRAFINDTPVNLSQLKVLASMLIDIHSQHENLLINESDFQMSVVDAYTGHAKVLDEYRQHYIRYKSVSRELEDAINQENEAKKEKDYLEFQVNEMEEARLEMGEDKKIEEELDLLNNAEQIKSQLLSSSGLLSDGEKNIIISLQEIKNKLSTISSYNTALADLVQRLNSSIIELKDIAGEIEGLEQKIHHDPEKASTLTERLEMIYSLAQKHRVKTVEELLGVQHEISKRLENISSLEDKIGKLQTEKGKLDESLKKLSAKITANRKKVIPQLEKDIQSNLLSLGMPNAQFRIDMNSLEQFSSAGMDSVQFMFSANKGKDLREVEKVASGGEMSRLMLVIKALIAKLTDMPTIIFDEIDTGVSGAIAGKIAELVLKITSSMQVIMISHLPQIASRGNTHFLVYKEDYKDKTITRIKQLNPEERVEEIARMISMGKPGSSALKTASELLQK